MDFAEIKTRGSSTELGFKSYIEALEIERQKIQVFQRELPLCLDLVTQTIERCKRVSSGAATTTEYLHGHQSEECNSEQTCSELGHHVFEEFMPLKRSCSSGANNDDDDDNDNDNDDVEDQDEQEHESPAVKSIVALEASSNKKEDWLRSVQLWNDPSSSDPPPPQQKQESAKKASATEVGKNGGGFQGFQKEKSDSPAEAPASDPATSSSGEKRSEASNSKENQRKQRRNWSPELHKRFLNALQQLGGSHAATPKQIRELMKVDGLTNDEVKSHLQKYRLHTRRPSQAIPNNNNNNNNGGSQTPQVVFVGGIWVQPSDFAAVTGDQPGNGAGGIYAPVVRRPNLKRSPEISNSPATSTSTHTTTISHNAY